MDDVGPPHDRVEPWDDQHLETQTREPFLDRLILAVIAALLGVGAAAVGWAIFSESGRSALWGDIYQAKLLEDCTGFRSKTCDVSLERPDGASGPRRVTLTVRGWSAGAGDVIRVRYRDDTAVPDSFPERGYHLGLVITAALVAVGLLSASLVVLLGVQHRVLEMLGLGLLGGFALAAIATFVLHVVSGPGAVRQ